jgi:hypothetical protein
LLQDGTDRIFAGQKMLAGCRALDSYRGLFADGQGEEFITHYVWALHCFEALPEVLGERIPALLFQRRVPRLIAGENCYRLRRLAGTGEATKTAEDVTMPTKIAAITKSCMPDLFLTWSRPLNSNLLSNLPEALVKFFSNVTVRFFRKSVQKKTNVSLKNFGSQVFHRVSLGFVLSTYPTFLHSVTFPLFGFLITAES